MSASVQKGVSLSLYSKMIRSGGLCTRFKGWGAVVGVLAFFVAAFVWPLLPVVPRVQFCAVKHFLGVPCPGCGLTKSLVALMHGRVLDSVHAHPLGIVIALWLIYFMGRSLFAALVGRWPRTLLTQRERDWLLGAFIIGMFVQWAAKLAVLYLPRG